MTETTEQQGESKEPTPEEIKAYKENMLKFYKEQIPFLKNQKEYEVLLADIEEARAKRMTMTMRMAQLLAPPAEAPPDGEQMPDLEKKERKLRKEE